MSIIDFYSLNLTDNPSEWPEISPEVQAFLQQTEKPGMFSPYQRAILDKIASSRWFLVRNDLGASSRYGVTQYLTLGGIELPFNGLTDLILVIQSYEPETQSQLISGLRPGSIVPISDEKAKQNISRLRSRGYMIYPNIDVD